MIDRVLIIAEAGVNHNGDINIAKQLIDVASNASVDFVKFQTFKAETLVSKHAIKADYQKVNLSSSDNSQFNMLKKLELSDSQHKELIAYCLKKNIKFFSTAFDTEGLDYLNSLGFKMFKVPSGEITNYPYLKKLAKFGKPVILSTGMSNMKEVRQAINILTSENLHLKDITVLHCNTEYPTPFCDVNLTAMNTMGSELQVAYGYSDHTLGIEVPIAAVALGASVIEKHFTLDRNLEGPDHRASLEPEELKAMVKSIRNIEVAIGGNGKKEPSSSEKRNLINVRKSLHIKRALKAGECIKEKNLMVLRPGNGVSPMEYTNVIGKCVVRDLDSYSLLKKEDIE